MGKTTDRSIPVSSFSRATGLTLRVRFVRRLGLSLGGKFYSCVGQRLKRPNVATRKALRDADARRNLLGPFEDTDSMFRELGV